MAVTGCTNPNANNYNPSATEDDGSCVFIVPIGDNCYFFQELAQSAIVDTSFTLSYSMETNSWVFFHDYVPDFYVGTRKKLYTLKDSKLWKHNSGPPGVFYDGAIKPFFIDVVFNYDQDVLLNSIQWFTELLSQLGAVAEFTTLTHITVWNDNQCTGKQPITTYQPYSLTGIRKTVSEFSFNELRDIVINGSGQFMTNIFGNLRPIDDALDATTNWYDKRFLQSNYFIVRLEYDNTNPNTLSLHTTGIEAQATVR